jgi:hypothetical protein
MHPTAAPDHFELVRQTNQAGVDFLKIEVRTALTFASIALESANDAEKRNRNRANARKAYEVAMIWFYRLSLSEAEIREIEEKLRELRSALKRLGERL